VTEQRLAFVGGLHRSGTPRWPPAWPSLSAPAHRTFEEDAASLHHLRQWAELAGGGPWRRERLRFLCQRHEEAPTRSRSARPPVLTLP
jgi:hypothetical protein